jgi:hypothetical protein
MAHEAEILIRIDTVVEMILKGLSRSEIVRQCNSLYGINSRMADNYIADAKKIIKEQCDKNIEQNIATAYNRFNLLFQKSYAIQDYSECRQIQQSINKLLGLDAAVKTDITTKGEKINDIDTIKKAFLESIKINDSAE